MNRLSARPANSLSAKLAIRAYTLLMRYEGMWVVPLRRRLLGMLTGQRYDVLNIFPQVFIEGAQNLRIGNHVSINRNTNLSCEGGITIGDNVAIGHGTSIISTNHGFADAQVPINYQPVSYAPVVIGSNVWIGAKATILAGVTIPQGCIIAAGAIVTKSVAERDSIIAGVPARRISSRFE